MGYCSYASSTPREGGGIPGRVPLILWESSETCLVEVAVEGEGFQNALPLHDNEGDTVRERVPLVRAVLEETPSLVKQNGIDSDQANGWTAKEAAADLERLGMPSLAVKVRDNLIEDITGRHQERQPLDELEPMPTGGIVALIVYRFKGDDVPCVEKKGAHSAAL
jgi:hypothetical protein